MSKPLPSKLPHVGTTIFTEMSALAQQCQAINLGQGFPDYPPPDALIQAVSDAMRQGHNQYAPMAGMPVLREAIASKVQTQHGQVYESRSEITVTAGATEALMSSFLALAHPGDEILLIDPAYDLYAPSIRLAGASAVRIPMQAPETNRPAFRLDWNRVENAITSKTRMLVLNFPHNPTGLTLKPEDLDALETILSKHPILLLSDEAYEHIVFDGQAHLSPVTRPSLADRTILISSFGKTFHATGWKVGYCCAPADITAEIRKVHQFTVFSVSTPMQAGIARHLRESDTLSELSGFYQKKRDRLVSGLQKTVLRPLYCEGTFFLLVDTQALGPGLEKELAVRLTRDVGVASIPVSAFYAEPGNPKSNHGLLRLCFAKLDATLDQALERLHSIRSGLAG
ncbi:methionine aminotransferase [Castellaniella ginsengisoli]|uniref:Methionine aminotransferase n=1 Tax=Castellaniella ginsengisoli TaxID=546114 RepID=A0AB39F3A5_9BURK